MSSRNEDGSQSNLSNDNSNLMTTSDGDAFNSSPVADDSHMNSMHSSSSVLGKCHFVYYLCFLIFSILSYYFLKNSEVIVILKKLFLSLI